MFFDGVPRSEGKKRGGKDLTIVRKREDASNLQRQRLPARYLAMLRFDQLRPHQSSHAPRPIALVAQYAIYAPFVTNSMYPDSKLVSKNRPMPAHAAIYTKSLRGSIPACSPSVPQQATVRSSWRTATSTYPAQHALLLRELLITPVDATSRRVRQTR